MASLKPQAPIVAAIRNGLARLAEVAPTSITMLTEENDWALLGGDLRNAMNTVADEQPAEDRDVVEA